MRMRALAVCLLAAVLAGASPAQASPDAIVRDALLPYLHENLQALYLFAAEMNLSNGTREGFGERFMFGKLVTAEWVMANLDALEADHGKIYAEVERLLFGPWENGGGTVFAFAERKNVCALSYETGRWGKPVERVRTIRITHTTEMSNRRRAVHITLDTLEIVRKK